MERENNSIHIPNFGNRDENDVKKLLEHLGRLAICYDHNRHLLNSIMQGSSTFGCPISGLMDNALEEQRHSYVRTTVQNDEAIAYEVRNLLLNFFTCDRK